MCSTLTYAVFGAFKEIREPFLTSIEKTLGDRYTDRMKKIYEAFIEYLIKTLIEGFNS
jgi:hypothetical protein